MFVATSKPHVFAKRIIDHFGLNSYFEHVFGSELDGTHVHKNDLLAHALRQTGADPAQALMIGDRSHDVAGAKANGMDAIGVTYGYGSREELIGAGVRHLCASPRAVLELIQASFLAGRNTPANVGSAVNLS
jgi:phosphoglycolate phosphatase